VGAGERDCLGATHRSPYAALATRLYTQNAWSMFMWYASASTAYSTAAAGSCPCFPAYLRVGSLAHKNTIKNTIFGVQRIRISMQVWHGKITNRPPFGPYCVGRSIVPGARLCRALGCAGRSVVPGAQLCLALGCAGRSVVPGAQLCRALGCAGRSVVQGVRKAAHIPQTRVRMVQRPARGSSWSEPPLHHVDSAGAM
jgi:hypothetical protein